MTSIDSSGLTKFNLNNYIFVQITQYGKEWLIDNSGMDFWENVIESRKVIIDGEEWYELQAHNIPDYFGAAVWAFSPAPIKSNILVSNEKE